MAQFGTIADWLQYDRIKQAQEHQNLVGEAVGKVGEVIGELVAAKGGKKKEAKSEITPKNDLLKQLESSVPSAKINAPQPEMLEGTSKIPTLQQEKERPTNDPQQIIDAAPPPPPLPEDTYEPAELAKQPSLIGNLLSSTGYMTPTETTGSLYNYGNQNYGGTLDLNRLKDSPIERKALGVQSGESVGLGQQAQKQIKKRAYNPRQDSYLDAQARSEMIYSTMPGGNIAADAYNASIKKKAYARQAFDKAQEGLEDNFSKLDVPSSGVNSIDGATQLMSKQAKKAFVELEANKYSMDPTAYTMAKSALMNTPKVIGQSMNILKQRVSDFAENRHLLSKGNNPETIDILDSLSKNEGDIVPVMDGGIAYLRGTTGGGAEVNVPLSEITNGKNDFKFLTRFDPGPELTSMVDKYGKMKTEAEFRTGTGTGTEKTVVPIEAFENDVKRDLNKMLADPNTLRSVVGDYLDADFDTFEEIKAAGLDPKELALNELYGMFTDKFNPVSQTSSIENYRAVDQEERQLKLDALKSKATAAELQVKAAKSGGLKGSDIDSLSTTFSDPNFYASFESPEGISPEVISATIGAQAVVDEDDPSFLIIQDPGAPNQEIRISRKGPQARKKAIDILARQVFKVKDINKIKITPPGQSTGGPKQQFTLPKKQE